LFWWAPGIHPGQTETQMKQNFGQKIQMHKTAEIILIPLESTLSTVAALVQQATSGPESTLKPSHVDDSDRGHGGTSSAGAITTSVCSLRTQQLRTPPDTSRPSAAEYMAALETGGGPACQAHGPWTTVLLRSASMCSSNSLTPESTLGS